MLIIYIHYNGFMEAIVINVCTCHIISNIRGKEIIKTSLTSYKYTCCLRSVTILLSHTLKKRRQENDIVCKISVHSNIFRIIFLQRTIILKLKIAARLYIVVHILHSIIPFVFVT